MQNDTVYIDKSIAENQFSYGLNHYYYCYYYIINK